MYSQIKKQSAGNSGFTLIEALLVMGLVAIILSFINVSVTHPLTQSSLEGEALKIVAEAKSQQNKAMMGDTEGGASPQPYGIKVEANRYTLFRGAVYNPADTNNFIVNLPTNIDIAGNYLPSGVIVFGRRSGEISGFTASSSFSVRDTVNSQIKMINFENQFGRITINP